MVIILTKRRLSPRLNALLNDNIVIEEAYIKEG